MKQGIIITIALVALLIPAMLQAQDACPSKAKTACTAKCAEAMKLSEEQQEKMAELKMEQEIAGIKLGAELKILRLKMKQEMSKDDPSEKELKTLVTQIADVQEKQHMREIEHMLAVRKILGPEKWKLHKKCCGGMGHDGMGMCACGSCGGGHGCCEGMCGCHGRGGHGCCMGACGSGCGDRHVWIERGGAGCREMHDMGGSCIIKMDGSGVCGKGETVDMHKTIKARHPAEVKKIKALIEKEDAGEMEAPLH